MSAAVIPTAPNARPGFLARLPWFTFAIAGTLAFKFNTELRAATDTSAPSSPGHFTLLALGGSDRAQVLGQGEWWRLFTASALHASPAHLIGNLVALIVCGWLLEPLVGMGWFASIYFTGALSGALLSMLLNPPDLLSVGASGAIMACLAALFALSFHSGAARPRLMRRVAGFLLFPALVPSVSQAGITDINDHLGGVLAGSVIAFVLLALWREEDAEPPGRSLAALLAGALLALTVWSFTLSWSSYDRYARTGLDYIPAAAMPHDPAAMMADSFALVDKYPRDPRAHLFRGLYFFGQNDASDAEPHLREALRLGPGMMSQDFLDWTKALLALDVKALGRGDEATIIVAPLCHAAGLDARTQAVIAQGHLCD